MGAAGQSEPDSPAKLAERFLEVAADFQLGELVTEQPHPETRELSRLAREDLPGALGALKRVDLAALTRLREYATSIERLAVAFEETLECGGRIVLCGCGATGRLSISLESFARADMLGEGLAGRVVGFMAGGDAALVRSIERFEDYPDYGARQLHEMDFSEDDLLVGITEGGETPFVIGSTEEAARISRFLPFFLYCNPDSILSAAADRSRRVLENPGIRKLNLTVGPMAITGSTRMQASTVQMAAVGWALACRKNSGAIGSQIESFAKWVQETDWSFLAPFIERESAIYDGGGAVLYRPGVFGITVLTDTTERSPTFSLPPFENAQNPDDVPSSCYLHVEGAEHAAEAWREILGRNPRTLPWGGLEHLTGEKQLLGFDFSDAVLARRAASGGATVFVLENREDSIHLEFGALSADVPAGGRDLFSRQLVLKLLLNAHSTLVMGRRGRFAGNVMTHLNATNNKLIDRAIRYVRMLLETRHGLEIPYEDVARRLFEVRAIRGPEEPIVLKTVERIVADTQARSAGRP